MDLSKTENKIAIMSLMVKCEELFGSVLDLIEKGEGLVLVEHSGIYLQR